MSTRQKILAIRLTEKLAKNPEYARGVLLQIVRTAQKSPYGRNI